LQYPSPKYSLEFWADSFHEGSWACESLKEHLRFEAVEYLQGFIPRYRFKLQDGDLLQITVLGSYKSWSPIPPKVAQLLAWGKPDLIVYDPVRKLIVMAAEETAAVPTGNQALQRCERMYGSARVPIPFWYLLPEYGRHKDNHVRRDSIWPTVLALKLTMHYGVPSVVLHYGKQNEPEAYDAGTGVRQLFRSLAFQVELSFRLREQKDFQPILTEQYQSMLAFIESQWKQMTRYLPGKAKLSDNGTAESLAKRKLKGKVPKELAGFLVWDRVVDLPAHVRMSLAPQTLIKPDSFLSRVEQQVGKSCYTLTNKTGSRPQDSDDVRVSIEQQRKLGKYIGLVPPASFTLDLSQFPKSKAGRRHVTTAKNVIYLFDTWSEFYSCLVAAYPRLQALRDKVSRTRRVLLYVSNSIKPGRIFGDPFTGQLAAYAFTFGKGAVEADNRIVVAYYPHQVHSQLINGGGQFNRNKGITLMREVADYAVFHGGVAVAMKTGEIF